MGIALISHIKCEAESERGATSSHARAKKWKSARNIFLLAVFHVLGVTWLLFVRPSLLKLNQIWQRCIYSAFQNCKAPSFSDSPSKCRAHYEADNFASAVLSRSLRL